MGTKGVGYKRYHYLTNGMPSFQDEVYLATDQYRDAGNLNARIYLHKRYSTNPYGWFRWVFDQIELPLKSNILEVGCGSGKLWLENLDRVPEGWQITLSDFSPGMVIGCRPDLAYKSGQFRFTVTNTLAIPFQAEIFDAVIADHMLYHVAERKRALADINRVLKPGGTFYAATNGENHLVELDRLINQIYQTTGSLVLGKPSTDFSLENGAAQLASWFSQVELRDYQDSLEVTEVEPLVAYMISMLPRQADIHRLFAQDMNQVLRNMIQQRGSIHIQKSSGLFIARK